MAGSVQNMPMSVEHDRIRLELDDFTKLRGGTAMDTEGPLWYRGLAQGEEGSLHPHVEEVLRRYEVERIVVGHTQPMAPSCLDLTRVYC